MVSFWYNTALFEQAGIEAAPANWEEFLSTVSTLKEAGITPISVGEGEKWPGHFYWVYLAIRTGGKDAFDAATLAAAASQIHLLSKLAHSCRIWSSSNPSRTVSSARPIPTPPQ